MITKSEIEYINYGRCLELSNGIIRLVVTLDVGPRVICYSFCDGENIMFEDVNRVFSASGEDFDEVYGGGTWYIYGGHRLWTSPEGRPKSYYPDNEPIAYELTECGASFMPPMQKWNQYAYTIDITLEDESTNVTLTHKVTNCAAWPVTLAPWPITVLSPGGVEVVPQPTRDTGLLGNRLLALWPYSRMTDPRVTWGDRYIFLRQDSTVQESFKVGINSEHGYALYFNHGDLFVKQFSPKAGGNYPDGGMSFETYTNHLFLEMETLGETSTIEPGASAVHTERWSLYKAERPELTEKAIDGVVKQYVR